MCLRRCEAGAHRIHGQVRSPQGAPRLDAATLDGGCCRNVKIALGAVAPMPIRARNAERVLEGKEINDAVIEQAARAAAAESRPITDVRASADYRREMVKVFTQWAIRKVVGKKECASDETPAVL